MLSLQTILIIIAILVGIEILLMIAIFINKERLFWTKKTVEKVQQNLINHYFNDQPLQKKWSKNLILRQYVQLAEQIQFSPQQKETAFQDFKRLGLIRKYLRSLNSISSLKRKTAIFYLSYFVNPEIRGALVDRFRIETIDHVRIFLVNALKNDMDQLTVQSMIESLVGSRRFYQARVIEIIKSYLLTSQSYFPDIYNRPEIEIKEFFVDVAGSVFRDDFRQPLLSELVRLEQHRMGNTSPVYEKMRPLRVNRLYYHLLFVLSDVYNYNLESDLYLRNPDPQVVEIAMKSLAKTKTFAQIEKILSSADGSASDNLRVFAITRIIESNKTFYDQLLELLQKKQTDTAMKIIVKTLITRVEYLLLKLQANDKSRFSFIIGQMIESNSTADLIGFLNKNKNKEVQKSTLDAIRPYAKSNPLFLSDLNEYLNPELLKELGYIREKKLPPERPRSGSEKSKTVWLIKIILAAFIIIPISFVIVQLTTVGERSLIDVLKTYIVLSNEIFVVYYLAVNAVYLIVAGLSWYGTIRQNKLWSIKSRSMMFEKGMLSSISIIAPAYNEERSIVESVQALMNLNYPDFEVIVVNDGSKDGTLEQLISHFQLDRKNVFWQEKLKTRPIKAVYVNKKYPNLLVVDKLNGGKADALNVGINLSKNDYICGIDADSILESESLLRLMSSMLDHDQITLALGGNIFPVNGCEVDHGQIESKGLATNWLARLQSIEYLRAFSLSRVGWSQLRSLLIVSGAFGLFEKQILIESGGYLTQSTKDKDTVGEDMELVVRITRQAYDTHLKFRIDYIQNATCYTEVPEELKSLLKQRNRWQRGLVDILSYHRKMIFNPRYQTAGLIATPYFFLFEMVGPLLEIQGFIALFLGIIFGLLSLEIVLLLMILTVMMGILLSLLALLVSERDAVAINPKDTLILLAIAIVENFGWRQFIAFYRIKGIFSSLKETNVWGTVKRVGFKK